MKATKLVTTAAVATLGLTLLSPVVLAADEASTFGGRGTVTFKEDDGEEPTGDPEEKTELITPPTEEVNNKKGPLRVDRVTTLNFGEHNISTKKGLYTAAAVKDTSTDKDKNEKEIVRGNWIQVTDKRQAGNDGLAKGWKLSATLSKQFQTSTAQIKGATIKYENPLLTFKDEDGSTTNPRQDLLADGTKFKKTAMDELKAKEDGTAGDSVEMISATKGNGFGTYYLQFGRNKDYGGTNGEDTTGKSVTLMVPANTPLQEAAYNAEITWTISELPGA